MLFFISVLSGHTAHRGGHVVLEDPEVGQSFYANVPLINHGQNDPPVLRKLMINGIDHSRSTLTATIVGM